jgi:hypothetical protein
VTGYKMGLYSDSALEGESMGLRRRSAAGARGRFDWRLVDRRVLPALTSSHYGLIYTNYILRL